MRSPFFHESHHAFHGIFSGYDPTQGITQIIDRLFKGHIAHGVKCLFANPDSDRTLSRQEFQGLLDLMVQAIRLNGTADKAHVLGLDDLQHRQAPAVEPHEDWPETNRHLNKKLLAEHKCELMKEAA